MKTTEIHDLASLINFSPSRVFGYRSKLKKPISLRWNNMYSYSIVYNTVRFAQSIDFFSE